VLVVWRFDRLGRTLKHLIELMAELEQQGIDFHSIQEAIDITTRAASWPSIQAFGLSLDFPLGLASHKGGYATPTRLIGDPSASALLPDWENDHLIKVMVAERRPWVNRQAKDHLPQPSGPGRSAANPASSSAVALRAVRT